MDRLVPGIDNTRFDIRLSPAFCATTERLVAFLIEQETNIRVDDKTALSFRIEKEEEKFCLQYEQIVADVIEKAKTEKEIQVDFLSRIAVINMIHHTIRKQYDGMIRHCKTAIHQSGLMETRDSEESASMKGNLARVLSVREHVQQVVGIYVCNILKKIRETRVRELRESVFGQDLPFFLDILNNPIVHQDNPFSDDFMMTVYHLCLGRRVDDPDRYEMVLNLLRTILTAIDVEDGLKTVFPLASGLDRRQVAWPVELSEDDIIRQQKLKRIDPLLQNPENIDILLGWEVTKEDIRKLENEKADETIIEPFRLKLKTQRTLETYFFQQFSRSGLMERILAAHEMQTLYTEYCPPLIPRQIIQYLTFPKSRSAVRTRLDRMEAVSGKKYPLSPLNQKVAQIARMRRSQKKIRLFAFLKNFLRYNRDYFCFTVYRKAASQVHLITDEKLVALSRTNRTLYEFLLPHEQEASEKSIIHHTLIKADLRGIADIIHQMHSRKIRPAPWFSSLVFDPMTKMLGDYGAKKVGATGDALFFSTVEYKDTSDGWYSVSRACGMAVTLMTIFRQTNKKSRKDQLPALETGIGICYRPAAPVFLFDGDTNILISPAMAMAGQLAGCNRSIRQRMHKKSGLFNVFVFQDSADEEMLRYNINGIELDEAGFQKLSEEIQLISFLGDIPDLGIKDVHLYTGKFKTTTGRYQRLIIREADIAVIDVKDVSILHLTNRKYYEICTSPSLYKRVKSIFFQKKE